jgi:hypothetical protein
MTREQCVFRKNGFASGQIADESFSAGFYTLGRKRAGSFSVSGKIGYKDTKVLISEFLRAKGHHFSVGGEAGN